MCSVDFISIHGVSCDGPPWERYTSEANLAERCRSPINGLSIISSLVHHPYTQRLCIFLSEWSFCGSSSLVMSLSNLNLYIRCANSEVDNPNSPSSPVLGLLSLADVAQAHHNHYHRHHRRSTNQTACHTTHSEDVAVAINWDAPGYSSREVTKLRHSKLGVEHERMIQIHT